MSEEIQKTEDHEHLNCLEILQLLNHRLAVLSDTFAEKIDLCRKESCEIQVLTQTIHESISRK